MKSVDKHLLSKPEVLDYLRKNECDIVITMGAGDIDGQAENIIEILKSK
jgi:UDP-N-acetylmuramate-alanine ligase